MSGETAWSGEDLRALVRAVIRDVLPDGVTPSRAEVVTVASDGDLDALVRRVADLCEDPDRRAALREGRHGFRLAGEGHRWSRPAEGGARPAERGGSRQARPPERVTRVDGGAVTERMVARAAKEGARLVLGPRAVLTPLARDRARVLGVEIERKPR